MSTCQPVFVIGVARAGTTLLVRALSSHSNAEATIDSLESVYKSAYIEIAKTVCLEFEYDIPFFDAFFSEKRLQISKALKEIDLQKIDISSHKEFFCKNVAQRSELYSPIPLSSDFLQHSTTLPDAIRHIMREAERRNHNIMVFKDNYCIEFVWALKKAFPSAVFIFPYRDPRAVVASRIAGGKKFGISSDIHLMSRIRAWRSHLAWAFAAKHAFPNDVFMISYENFVAHPQEWLEKICSQLHIKYEESMLGTLGFGKFKNNFEWHNNSSFECNQTSGVYTDSVERWKEELPVTIIQGIEYLAFHEMTLLGYKPETLLPPPYTTEDAYRFLENDTIADKDCWRCDTLPFKDEIALEQGRHTIIGKQFATLQEIEYNLLTPALAQQLGVQTKIGRKL